MSDGQSKGRKFGRHSQRSPSMQHYRLINKAAVNKAKRAKKEAKKAAKKAAKVIKVPHGTARAKRRAAGGKNAGPH